MNNEFSNFMGREFSYWTELQAQADTLNVTHLIQELAKAHAKLGYLEDHVRQMAQYVEQVNKI
jgi:predicted DNA-binding ribbon-helix-helix protein